MPRQQLVHLPVKDMTLAAHKLARRHPQPLAASGATLDHVVKITVFMTDVSELQTFRDVRDSYFRKEPPASSLVQVAGLVRSELMIEIEAVAVVGSGE
jgi:enamine deaminase RidA (YjgF/YER057c/UK114 family)